MSGARNNFLDEGAGVKGALPGMEASGFGSSLGKHLNSQALVLVIIITVGAGALIAMRQMGLKAGLDMTAVQSVNAAAISRDDPEKMARYERIMADLKSLQAPLDISSGELAKIPLLLDGGTKGPAINPEDPNAALARQAAIEERKRNERLARLKDQVGKLTLQSVIGGRMPVARINGQTVKVGDTVAEHFKVKSILDRSVQLEVEGETFELEMGNAKSQTNPRTRR